MATFVGFAPVRCELVQPLTPGWRNQQEIGLSLSSSAIGCCQRVETGQPSQLHFLGGVDVRGVIAGDRLVLGPGARDEKSLIVQPSGQVVFDHPGFDHCSDVPPVWWT